MTSPTGTQYVLRFADQEAIITEMGAGLRAYRVAGRDLVTTFDEQGTPEGCQGQQLMPWPNRIRDGRWMLDGVTHQLPVNEPERGNAIHGLVRERIFELVSVSEELLTQRLRLEPEQGWPGSLELVVTHRLSEAGLGVTVNARNVGDVRVPFGYAAHPYLLPPGGATSIDECELGLPFEQRLASDDRLLPVALESVAGGIVDRRTPAPVAGLVLDTAFRGARREGATWEATLSAAGERTVLWGDAAIDWVQIYTPGDRLSIAVEPMTVGPDAFNPGPTHEDLVVLEPGSETSCSWGLRNERDDV